MELEEDGGHVVKPQGLFLVFGHQLGVQLIHSCLGLVLLQQGK